MASRRRPPSVLDIGAVPAPESGTPDTPIPEIRTLKPYVPIADPHIEFLKMVNQIFTKCINITHLGDRFFTYKGSSINSTIFQQVFFNTRTLPQQWLRECSSKDPFPILVENGNPIILIAAFDMQTYVDWNREFFKYYKTTAFYDILYNRYVVDQTSPVSDGVNVYRNARVVGRLYSHEDVISYLSTVTENDHRKLINQHYYYGKNNSLLAFVNANGFLIIRWEAVMKLISENEVNIVQRVLVNLFQHYSDCYRKISNPRVTDIIPEMVEEVSGSIWFQATPGLRKLIEQAFPNDENIRPKLEAFYADVARMIKDNVETRCARSTWGINGANSYASILKDYYARGQNLSRRIAAEKFNEGVQFGLKFEGCGWIPCKEEIPGFDPDTIWWAKEVDIVPSRIYYDGKNMIINEEYRKKLPYRITKLYLNSNGTMAANGKHPNVSSRKVCMGDLDLKSLWEMVELKTELLRAERLLELINYGSAYDNTLKEEVAKNSTESEILNLTTKVKKDRPVVLRSLESVDDVDGFFDEDESTEVSSETDSEYDEVVVSLTDVQDGIERNIIDGQHIITPVRTISQNHRHGDQSAEPSNQFANVSVSNMPIVQEHLTVHDEDSTVHDTALSDARIISPDGQITRLITSEQPSQTIDELR